MTYLIIETSTEKGVIGCLDNHTVLFVKELPCGQNQSQFLMTELENSIRLYGINLSRLSYIGVGIGPGSYTGIRVGASVAQALAYSLNIPLVGIPSLNGFVPRLDDRPFAAMIDARIGGVYLRKGVAGPHGVRFTSEPEVCEIGHLPPLLENISTFVTPNSQALQKKINHLLSNPANWEERYPCLHSLARSAQKLFLNGESCLPGALKLMYLRKTEAERQKELSSNA